MRRTSMPKTRCSMSKRTLCSLCSGALLVSLSSPVPAQDERRWILMAANDYSSVYLDAASIRRTSSGILFRQRIEFTDGDDGRKRAIELHEARCANRETRVVESTVHYGDGRNVTSGAGAWRYVTPDTVGEDVIKFVCSFTT